MQFAKNITPLILLFGLLAYTANGLCEQKSRMPLPGAASAQGQLMVTLTVIASVGIVFDSHGVPTLMQANLPNQSDNVSWLRPVKADLDRGLETKPALSKKKHP